MNTTIDVDTDSVSFNIPVTRLPGESVTVTIDESRVYEYARHGIKQIVNDSASGMKLSGEPWNGDRDSWEAAVMARVTETADRVSKGDHKLAGVRAPKKKLTPRDLAGLVEGLDSTMFDALVAAIESRKTAAAAA